MGDKVRARTLSELKLFFIQFKYDKFFTREDIKIFFNVKKSRASEILALLLKNNIIENVEGSKYRFKR